MTVHLLFKSVGQRALKVLDESIVIVVIRAPVVVFNVYLRTFVRRLYCENALVSKSLSLNV
jgi:hypothetical protein